MTAKLHKHKDMEEEMAAKPVDVTVWYDYT